MRLALTLLAVAAVNVAGAASTRHSPAGVIHPHAAHAGGALVGLDVEEHPGENQRE